MLVIGGKIFEIPMGEVKCPDNFDNVYKLRGGGRGNRLVLNDGGGGKFSPKGGGGGGKIPPEEKL